jgi:PTS system nitrogen regulatory IIA component
MGRWSFMPILEFLSPDSVVTSLRARAKKQILQELSAHAVRQLPALDEREVFETLQQRERLGSTGIGDGVAIPHGKLPGLDRLFGLVARLERPVDFESLDGQPIDIAFLLLAPEGAGAEHLKALAQVARLLREPGVLDRIRAARDASALYALLTQPTKSEAA